MLAASRLPRRDRRARPALPAADLGDVRFSALLPAADWARLPPAVRRRFSKRLDDAATAVYAGHVTRVDVSRLGWLLAQALRPIGAPLPLSRVIGAPTVVTVSEEGASGGQNWTRMFARARGFPQIIHSTKRFSGPTGLEEYIGFGVGMTLTIDVVDAALVFRSAGYFLQAGRLRLMLPSALTPGRLTVTHREMSPSEFLFTLNLAHPVFGVLVHQNALYREVPSWPAASC